ncbi:uncharacterized protein LOC117121856 [Anneissia japonica]|uniref:uncharacterized protein LOC117121856 n=1 Tax=Anneissia japonica TaxID=1529436 RepID=UPI00142569BD|nr:uncharacterized protein LOC117121856 [Anneissia japonica]
MLYIILQLLHVTRLCLGSQGYITLLNVKPIEAESNFGFQCFTPLMVPGEDVLSYGRSYKIDSTDSLVDTPWPVTATQTRYITTNPPVADSGNVGVYYCKFVNDGVTTIAQTTKIDSNAVLEFSLFCLRTTAHMSLNAFSSQMLSTKPHFRTLTQDKRNSSGHVACPLCLICHFLSKMLSSFENADFASMILILISFTYLAFSVQVERRNFDWLVYHFQCTPWAFLL